MSGRIKHDSIWHFLRYNFTAIPPKQDRRPAPVTWLESLTTFQWPVFLLILFGGVLLGCMFTRSGFIDWDEPFRYQQSLWQLGQMNFDTDAVFHGYSSIWFESLLGLVTEILFPFVRDPHWIRTSINFAFFPLTLYLIVVLLRSLRVRVSTALLASALLFGYIRFGGHALMNVKDFQYAAVFVLASIALFLCFVRLQQAIQVHRPLLRWLVLIACIDVLPFLTRQPDLSHWIVATLVLLGISLFSEKLTLVQRLQVLVIPTLLSYAMLAAFYPDFRGNPLIAWVELVDWSSQFPMHRRLHFLGRDYWSTSLPWWYSFPWLMVGTHAVVFFLVVIGLVSQLVFAIRSCSERFVLRVFRYGIPISLQVWLWLFVVIAWTGILAFSPVIYDQERHILFLYPIVIVFGALGLDFLPDRSKFILTTVVVFAGTMAYAQWGRYSYDYLSPPFFSTHADGFWNDGRRLCLGPSIRALRTKMASGSTIAINHWVVSAGVPQIYQDRLRESLFFRDPTFPQYHFVGWKPAERPFVAIVNNLEPWDQEEVLQDIKAGKATLLGKEMLPSGVAACITAYYP